MKFWVMLSAKENQITILGFSKETEEQALIEAKQRAESNVPGGIVAVFNLFGDTKLLNQQIISWLLNNGETIERAKEAVKVIATALCKMFPTHDPTSL